MERNNVNKTVTSKDGQTISVCNFRYVDMDGDVHTCHHVALCKICGGCSRLVGDHETGHCTGHLGLKTEFWDYHARAPEQQAQPEQAPKRHGRRKAA
jgi:hypothetical protein